MIIRKHHTNETIDCRKHQLEANFKSSRETTGKCKNDLNRHAFTLYRTHQRLISSCEDYYRLLSCRTSYQS